MIPVMSPRDAQHFLDYFRAVESVLAKRFLVGFAPNEEHLNAVLCELLDPDASALHALEYSLAHLNENLAADQSLLQAQLSIRASQYSKHVEAHRTHADIGVVVRYQDNIDPQRNMVRAVLWQAKRLYPNSAGKWGLDCRYRAFDADQAQSLKRLNEWLQTQEGDVDDPRHRHRRTGNCIQYLLYNPQLTALPAREQEYVLHTQLRRESEQIFDYQHGLHLYRELSEPGANQLLLERSAMVMPLHTALMVAKYIEGEVNELRPFSLRAAVDSLHIREGSFSWFMVFHLLQGRAGCSCPQFVDIVTGENPGMAMEFHVAPPQIVIEILLSAGSGRNG